ncbi:uncharacterized protein, partial [Diadema antillarum]|uniref:uncharacterized protein n=1 Tax=Diadema antillarum TaxID=105358 RepID=UPI003A89EDC5
MTKFWSSHSTKASLEEMMLDSNAAVLTQHEVPEVLSLLPDLEGKRVLELGAGIGRFTGALAKVCEHVTAVDFMASFIEENKKINGHHGNADFIQADVMSLELPPNSYDVIFSNWLFMYLSDDELVKLSIRLLGWLKDGGQLFFRESCLRPSGDMATSFNPTKYRHPKEYNAIFQSATSIQEKGGPAAGFELTFCRGLQSYLKLKNNPNQFCWLWHREQQERNAKHGFSSFQQFLDNKQYSLNGILRYEKVFGEGYVSTGGHETTEEFLKMLDLQPDQVVLDVGCGIGGGDFYMAKRYGVQVVGIDLSSNMIEVAMDRARDQKEAKVQFEIGDITKRAYADGSFDVIYSRDTLLHLKDKPEILRKFLSWLKPGGKLLISDYCCGELPHREDFKAYVAQRGYTLYTPKTYGELIETANFVNVRAEDRTWQFQAMLEKELAKILDGSQNILEGFSAEDVSALRDGWKSKIQRVKAGNQKWGLFYAEKAKLKSIQQSKLPPSHPNSDADAMFASGRARADGRSLSEASRYTVSPPLPPVPYRDT